MTHEQIISDLREQLNLRTAFRGADTIISLIELTEQVWVEVKITCTETLLRHATHDEPPEFDVKCSAGVMDIYCEDTELKDKIERAVNEWTGD